MIEGLLKATQGQGQANGLKAYKFLLIINLQIMVQGQAPVPTSNIHFLYPIYE